MPDFCQTQALRRIPRTFKLQAAQQTRITEGVGLDHHGALQPAPPSGLPLLH